MGSSTTFAADLGAAPNGDGGDDLFLYLSDLAPASPSAYLDLPPTPHHEQEGQPPGGAAGGGGGGSPASSGTPEDLVLPFISRMLMEEDIDDKFFYDYPDNPALLQAQQPFLDILSDPSSQSGSSSDHSHSNNNTGSNHLSPTSPSDAAVSPAAVNSYDPATQYPGAFGSAAPGGFDLDLDPAAFFRGGANSDLMSAAFLKGMEEANKFLPSEDKLVIDVKASSGEFVRGVDEANKFLPSEKQLLVGFNGAPAPAPAAPPSVVVSVKKEEDLATAGGRSRKNRYNDEELELEGGRNIKLTAVQGEDIDAREIFHQALMPSHENCVLRMQELRIAMENEAANNKTSGGGGKDANRKAKGRRGEKDVVDLRTLLIHCAQAVATDDRRSANELLKQIKQNAPPIGDATQRLAHCFAEGLQARLVGTGSLVHQSLMAKRTSAVEMLQAYQLYMAAICFKKVSYIFSNSTIYNGSLRKKKIHIIDYGIQYGFQWPCFLRRIADREGGPPEVRITGIDLPQPGFRPAERIEETGRRLSKYASEFKVPFKYHAIATSKMESIRKEDLNLDPEEVLFVNCQYQFKNLMDESVVIDSPRDIVLNNIRKMRPHAFIHAIINGSYSAPFFVTRFREALFYYSALFDILDTTTPRDSDQRLLIEQNIFGRGVLNVIACEGTDRVERPETYKQWQVRNQRAGLKQLPLNPDIIQMVRDKVTDHYHKDFVIDIDHQWLLQGWKGRILLAVSTWMANDDSP